MRLLKQQRHCVTGGTGEQCMGRSVLVWPRLCEVHGVVAVQAGGKLALGPVTALVTGRAKSNRTDHWQQQQQNRSRACIAKIADLQPLASCPKLTILNLQGNPVTEATDFQSELALLLPGVKDLIA
ncbi:UNVERIFIED_CONTAM: hypothetical protein FKN15_025713 [Acipenser sinensis]